MSLTSQDIAEERAIDREGYRCENCGDRFHEDDINRSEYGLLCEDCESEIRAKDATDEEKEV